MFRDIWSEKFADFRIIHPPPTPIYLVHTYSSKRNDSRISFICFLLLKWIKNMHFPRDFSAWTGVQKWVFFTNEFVQWDYLQNLIDVGEFNSCFFCALRVVWSLPILYNNMVNDKMIKLAITFSNSLLLLLNFFKPSNSWIEKRVSFRNIIFELFCFRNYNIIYIVSTLIDYNRLYLQVSINVYFLNGKKSADACSNTLCCCCIYYTIQTETFCVQRHAHWSNHLDVNRVPKLSQCMITWSKKPCLPSTSGI